jgi:TfoX/Sxy family transcriptional regulator of competence genes
MAYESDLAERVREVLALERNVREIKMMGGLCFMVHGHMAVGITDDSLLVRVGAEGYDRALRSKHAREWDFTGRTLTGFVQVDHAGIATRRSLSSWVSAGTAFVKKLPPKKKRRREAT